MEEKREASPSTFIVLVAVLLALRAVFFWYFLQEGGSSFQPDSERYLTLGATLAERGWFSVSPEAFEAEVFRTPGYPLFLSLFPGVEGQPIAWIVAAQELIYLFCAFLVYAGIRRLLGESLARACLVFMLLEPGGLAFPKLIASETLFLPFSLGAVLAAGLYLRLGGARWALLAGLLLGAAVVVRPVATYLPLLFLFVMWLARRPAGGLAAGAAALVLGFTLLAGPWVVRNAVHYGQPFISGQTSNMLARYHVPFVWETAKGLPFNEGAELVSERMRTLRRETEARIGRRLDAVERYNLERDWAVGELAAYPGIYAFRWAVGILKTLVSGNLTEVYQVADLRNDRLRYFEIEEPRLVPRVVTFITAQDPLFMVEVAARMALALLALIGAWAIVRGRDPFLWLILLVNLYFVFVPGPMGYARLRFPVEVFWFVQALMGLSWLAGRLGRWPGLRGLLPQQRAVDGERIAGDALDAEPGLGDGSRP
jgi:4-amino-4-deoxy-L-arabinose transferase-like glycosyltransferase